MIYAHILSSVSFDLEGICLITYSAAGSATPNSIKGQIGSTEGIVKVCCTTISLADDRLLLQTILNGIQEIRGSLKDDGFMKEGILT